MVLKELKDGIKRMVEERKQKIQEIDESPDDQTRDRYLRSLRRERRVQMEEQEKIKLKKKIAEYKKKRNAQMVLGHPDDQLLRNKKKKKIIEKKQSYLGRYQL